MNVFGGLVAAALIPAAAHAQATAQAPAAAHTQAAAESETDVAGSFFTTFTTKSVTGGGATQTSANSVGGMLELRHIQTPWIGYEFTYAMMPDNQTIAPIPGSCGHICANPSEALNATINQVSLDWVFSHQYGKLTPFAVAGAGFNIFVPQGISGTYLNQPVKPTWVTGGGVDWALTPRLGIRLQYRENIFTAPHIDPRYTNTGVFTPMGMPMFGVYFRCHPLDALLQ